MSYVIMQCTIIIHTLCADRVSVTWLKRHYDLLILIIDQNEYIPTDIISPGRYNNIGNNIIQ